MTSPSIVKLASLSDAFSTAVENKERKDLNFAKQILAAFAPADIEKLMQLMNDVTNSEHLEAAFSGDDDALNQELASKAVEIVNFAASVLTRKFSEKAIAEFMPEEARNVETAQAFDNAGAKTLARLCLVGPV